MGRNMSVKGLIEEERIDCISISMDELDKLDEYQQHEKLESQIIRFLENHPDEEVQKCGEVLRQIDRKQDGHILFLRKSEKKQIEEERRLLFVGITRAKEILRISRAELADAAAAYRQRVAAIVARPLTCARCGAVLRAEVAGVELAPTAPAGGV